MDLDLPGNVQLLAVVLDDPLQVSRWTALQRELTHDEVLTDSLINSEIQLVKLYLKVQINSCTLWVIHSVVIFRRAFMTCANGHWDDTAATVQLGNRNFRKKSKRNKTSRLSGRPTVYISRLQPSLQVLCPNVLEVPEERLYGVPCDHGRHL